MAASAPHPSQATVTSQRAGRWRLRVEESDGDGVAVGGVRRGYITGWEICVREIECVSCHVVPTYVESEAEYERQRAGLEAVRQAAEARLAAMEGEKARAVDMVGEAMESLEVLSNELHEAGQGGGGGGGDEGGAERPRADSTSVVETQHL